MTPFTLEELAAWVDAEYAALLAEKRDVYELQPGEFTAEIYAEQTGIALSTARRQLMMLREAGRIPFKKVKTERRWMWVYWRDEE